MTFDIELANIPSVARRLGAMLYDSLLLVGVLMVALAFFVIPYELLLGQAPYENVLARFLMQLYLLLVIAAFYLYFWTHGGQTLGMRAWRFRVIRDDGQNVNASDALKRLAWATLSLLPAGIGFWWALIDRDRLSWHDRRSGTRLVMLKPKSGG